MIIWACIPILVCVCLYILMSVYFILVCCCCCCGVERGKSNASRWACAVLQAVFMLFCLYVRVLVCVCGVYVHACRICFTGKITTSSCALQIVVILCCCQGVLCVGVAVVRVVLCAWVCGYFASSTATLGRLLAYAVAFKGKVSKVCE